MRALRRWVVVGTSMAIVAGSSSGAAAGRARPSTSYTPGRLILKVTPELAPRMAAGRAGGTDSGLDALGRRYGLRRVEQPFAGHASRAANLASRFARRAARTVPGAKAPDLERVWVLELSRALDMEQVAAEYARLPGVEWAEPDRIAAATLVPNDPFFSASGAWGQPYRDLWGLVKINASAAWDVTRGAGIVIAISDTGIDYTHPDIAAHVWTNPGEIPGNGIDDDHNGYVDDVRGWDFVNGDNDPFDDNGHGTHVAGTAAGVGNNGVGVTGVAWEAQVMAVKGLSSGGAGGTLQLAQTIVYATENGADVINASWGGSGRSQLESDAIAAAHAAGVAFVAAAGNGASEVGDFWPAGDPNAITVSAFDHTDRVADFSNFGPKIDVAAPGGGDRDPGATYLSPSRSILSLRSSASTFSSDLTVAGIYMRLSGTSMAAPHVTGAAALILAANPTFSVEQVRQLLRASADDVDAPGVDGNSGYGRINVGRALGGGFGNVLAVQITEPLPGSLISGTVTVKGTAAGPGFASYVLEYGAGLLPSSWVTIRGPITTPVQDGVLGTWNPSAIPDGDYVLRARALTTGGQAYESRIHVTLDRVLITAPTTEDIVGAGGAPVEIRGTAAGAGFNHYTVEYRIIDPDLTVGPWITTGVVRPGGGTTPVVAGLLATLDPHALPGGRDIDLRLSVTAGGTTIDEVDHVVVDRTLRPGWPRRLELSRFNAIPMRNGPTLADLDGDGTKEILLAWFDMVYVLRPDGTDLPGWPQRIASNPPESFVYYVDGAPTVADLDGDGRLEVIVSTTSFNLGTQDRAGEEIYVWHHDGTALAGWPRTVLPARPTVPAIALPKGDVVPADLDGDGQPELVYQFREALGVLRPDGTSFPGFPLTRPCGRLGGACFEGTVAVADVDGDGRKEIAVVESPSTDPTAPAPQFLYLLDATGQVKPGWPQKVTRRRVPENSPIIADFNGDGRLDLTVSGDKPARIKAFTAAGRKIVFAPRMMPQSARTRPFRARQDPPTAADLLGDGRAQLLVASDYPEVPVFYKGQFVALVPPYHGTDYLNVLNGAGSFAGWPVAFPFPAAGKTHGPGAASVGDIDGDGTPEIVIGSGTCAFWGYPEDDTLRRCYTVWAFRRDGSLVPGFPKPTPGEGPTKSLQPALGDLDGDGLEEIVWADINGNVLVWNVPGTPGPERMQWPMFRHDPAHSGTLAP